MASLMSMVKKDLLLTARSRYYLIIIVIAIVYAAMVRYLVPEEVKLSPSELFADSSSQGVLREYLQARAPERMVWQSRSELVQAMEEQANTVGIYASEKAGSIHFELLFQGQENMRLRHLLAVSLAEELDRFYNPGYRDRFQLVELEKAARREVPFRDFIIPILLFSEAGMVGLFLVASLVFLEKEEGSLQAYLVSGRGAWAHLWARCLAMVPIALVFTLLLTLLTVGMRVESWAGLIAIVILGSLLTAVISMVAASFFSSFSEYLYAAIVLMVVLTLPAITYLTPTFAHAALQAIPTYPMIFGIRDSLFGGGQVMRSIVALSVYLLVALVLLTPVYSRRLHKEVR